MPPRRPVELHVGGQTYRVVASDDDTHVQHLAEVVDRKLAEVVPHGLGRTVTAQQAMFLTAMALAAEVEEERSRTTTLEGERDRSLRLACRAREVVARLLQHVDGALSTTPTPTPVAASTTSDGARPGGRQALLAEVDPSLDDSPSPLDSLTDPPDALHEPFLMDLSPPPPAVESLPRERQPSLSLDVRQSLPLDVRQSPPLDVRPSLPRDVRPSLPRDARPSPPRDLRPSLPRDARPSLPRDVRPSAPTDDATVARTDGRPTAPRGGLRLVRQAGSPPDDDSR